MADSSYDKGLIELAKMKVADLKAELKQRGLPTTGNKIELVERLQLAIHDSSLSLDEAADEIIDEDAVLNDEELETEELSAKPDSVSVEAEAQKRKASTDENKSPAKKIILNRTNKIEDVKNNGDEKNEEETKNDKLSEEPAKKVIKLSNTNNERLAMRAKKFGMPITEAAKKESRAARFNSATSNGTTTNNNDNESVTKTIKTITVSNNTTNDVKEDKDDSEKKIIKLSELSTAERLEMRAKKFGVPLSDTAKKEARASRFNISSTKSTNNNSTKSASSIKNAPVPASYEVLKKRAERFGTNASTLLQKAEIEAKKEQRKARFGETKPVEKVKLVK